jgi:hypothetical protein
VRVALALGLFHVACGGSPPTVAPTAAHTSAAPASSVVSYEPPADVSPVPTPVGLGLTVHLAHPRATLQQLTPLVGSLVSLFTGGTKLDPDSLVATAVGAPVGAVIDLDQPIDLAVIDVAAPDKPPKVAASSALIDPAAARKPLEKYFKWGPTRGGVVLLQPRQAATDDGSPRPCMIAPSFGATPGSARLVCGNGENAVHDLAPYLTRTMTRLTSRDDVRVEVFVREIRPPRPGVTTALTGGGPAVVDAGPVDPTDALFNQLTDKVTSDVGSLVLEASFDSSTVDLRLTTSFVDAASPLTRALVGAGASSAPAPAAFDRLPSGAMFAWYGRGATAADLAPLRRSVFDGAHGILEDDGYTSAVSATLLAPLERLLLTGGPWVVATGMDLDAARAALDAYVGAGKTTEAARATARRAMQSWAVAAVEEPAQSWIDGMREIVKSDPIEPTGKPRRARDPQKERTRLSLAPVPVTLQLPAGTLQIEARVTQNPAWTAAQRKAKQKIDDPVVPHTVHVFVVPDGARTWFAAAEDPAVAAREVRGSLSGAPDAGTLKGRRDLEGFRSMPASTAGFVSVAGVATWLLGNASDQGLHRARESLTGLAALTDGGMTPVPLALAATPGTGGAASGGDVRLRILYPIRLGLEVATSPHSIF